MGRAFARQALNCFWLPYRARTVTGRTAIPWEILERQLGAEYAHARQLRDRLRRTLAAVPSSTGTCASS